METLNGNQKFIIIMFGLFCIMVIATEGFGANRVPCEPPVELCTHTNK